MQNITIYGHVGKEPEKKEHNGRSYYTYSVAVTTGFGDKKKTNWFNVSDWKGTDNLYKYINKGSAIVVAGSLSINEYKKADGSNGHSLNINASEISLAGKATGEVKNFTPKNYQPASSETEDYIPF
jgi:single stranded DNA-binding protein